MKNKKRVWLFLNVIRTLTWHDQGDWNKEKYLDVVDFKYKRRQSCSTLSGSARLGPTRSTARTSLYAQLRRHSSMFQWDVLVRLCHMVKTT